MWPPINGPPEVGDAPDPLYPSYRLNRGAVHGNWWYEWLGPGRDGEWDSEQVDADMYDDGVSVDLVAGTLTFTPTVSLPGSARYGPLGMINVHGWFDWNGDGDWDDADEFVVNWSGYPGDGTWPGGQANLGVTQPFTIPTNVFDNGDVVDLWARFRLDYDANWESPRDYVRFGEVEDHTFTVVRPQRPDWDGTLVPLLTSLHIAYTQIVSGVKAIISPTIVITPVWNLASPTPKMMLADNYGDAVTIEHEPFTPGQAYTLSLSSGVNYSGTQVVLPASFDFMATIRGVDLTPDTDMDSGSNGDTVVYTFTVKNTGSMSDSFGLKVANDDWPTSLSTSSVGPLEPNITTTVQVSVTVPVTAVAFSFDRATITATSVASPTVSASSVFTTEVKENYDMRLEPPAASLVDNPSELVTYTLTIYNDGNVTDTYDLTNTLTVWPTSLSTDTVGPIEPWDDESFEVYVTIPSGAMNGAQDVVTVTATSQGAPAKTDYSVLTTVATTQTITRGVEIVPPTDAKSGNTGSDVVYYLTMTNTGSITDTIILGANNPAWNTVVNPGSVVLGSNKGQAVVVTVSIPGAATDNQTDTVLITAQATGISDSSLLTTTALVPFSYGADLTPDTATNDGDNGETIVYTFTVKNMGNVSDNFDLEVTDDDWPADLSAGSVGPLGPNVTTTVQVSVTIPVTAVAYSFDRATITAKSVASPTVSASSVFTTEVEENYDMRLEPPTPSQTGNPSQTVTFTFTVHNDGNVTDTCDLTNTLAVWPTSFSTDTVGPIKPWDEESFEVYVTIPSSAANGAQDVVTVTATSQGAPAVSDYSVLTTDATTQTIINRSVTLTPDAVLEYGDNGDTVVFDFVVKNTSNVSDSFGLKVANDDWPTDLSASSVGPLEPNVTTTVQVSVTVPVTAVAYSFDRATITAQSVASSTVFASSVFTTEVAEEYGMRLEPPTLSQMGNPSKPVTFTFTVHNDGNVTDTFTTTHTFALWPTALSTGAVGPIAPWESKSFQVYVTIAGDAISGTRDVVTVLAMSQGSSLFDESVLTTTATTQIITRSVAIAPHAATSSGGPGDTVTYTLRVTNTGSVADVIELNHTGPVTWTVRYSANPLNLEAGEGSNVDVYVDIPPGTVLFSRVTLTVTAASWGDPSKTDAAVLTIEMGDKQFVYLPLITRNYPP